MNKIILNIYYSLKYSPRANFFNSSWHDAFGAYYRNLHPVIAMIQYTIILSIILTAFPFFGYCQSPAPFVSKPLIEKGDLAALMVEDVDRFLLEMTEQAYESKGDHWNCDFNSAEAFNQSIMTQREFLQERLGLVEERVFPKMEMMSNFQLQSYRIETHACLIQPVRWNVLYGMPAEGLLLQPKGKVKAQLIMIPDADMLPEIFAGLKNPDDPRYGIARRLAEAGWEVLIPVLINREDTFSGNPSLNRYTNQPHREWIYRQAYEVGRHVIGYELQKVFAALDWFELRNQENGNEDIPVGVAGYGEGGLLALYASSLDTRITSTLVSGYFDSRKHMWQEPIYRNVFGMLNIFGDAELAVMTWPRTLVVEHTRGPEVPGPPKSSEGRNGAAPGHLRTPDFSRAKGEWNRANSIIPRGSSNLTWHADGNTAIDHPFSEAAFSTFAKGLNITLPDNYSIPPKPLVFSEWVDAIKRQERTIRTMEQHVQRVLELCERDRKKNFWGPLEEDSVDQRGIKARLREKFRQQIGSLPTPDIPANPRSRVIEITDHWTSYDIQLDVWPGVFAWGILIVPNDIKKGEKRAVVVCQHGLEGVPTDVVTTDSDDPAYPYYKGFAAQLAERGYVTFSPFNLYRGGDKFRVLQRKGNPIGLTLFSIITGQHQRIVDWLQQQSFVDSARIGFYGLSYGGKTAMRVPALVEDYALSICSADFNDWVRKCATTDYPFSYMFSGEYDMPEWNLGHSFNYAEMAGLIAPRPFMVERGHFDGVGIDEWIGFEYEKVRRHYHLINLPNSTDIEYFVGPHSINGVGTFEFLDRHLKQIPDETQKE